ncbi:hypothetical protein BY996DRAFT_4579065 [Phakopsora pachyrhizi]|uniref:DUF7872 domain-containing protein n=1 Tax=Phakopsora pachyrhizi TaxID=170000 RepID=A0AAV0BHM2_PHAPC|nr:hypothetical protein BY996DRAFT_4579065 [Phakopsora pachyrhizi]CAH7686049.1 hypothetical protein PPACK8108_LOCUS20649 [Phakopsora pachyrhizi]
MKAKAQSAVSIFLTAYITCVVFLDAQATKFNSTLSVFHSPSISNQSDLSQSYDSGSPSNDFICQSRNLSPSLWNKLDLNRYLLNYPGGQDISLEQLAIDSKLLNFDCGISKMCYAGQLCSPVVGKNWYILVAAQEWNSYINIMYESIGFAMTMMQGIIPSMIKDLFPDEKDDWAIAKAYLTFASSLAKVHPTEGHTSFTKWWMQLVQGQVGLAAGESNIMDYAVVPDPVNQHDKWSYFIFQLSKNQDRIQGELTKSSEEIVSSGISTESGIYGVLKDGIFLIDHVHPSRFVNFSTKEQLEMKTSIELHLLAAIWTKQKYFIVRGSDPCEYSGPNGAFGGRDELSYCGPDNIMMSIVKVKRKNKLSRKVYNGDMVFEKYNFTTDFLIERAWNCQNQLKKFGFDVWNSSSSIEVVTKCSFNLPVCDLTSPGIRRLRKKKSIVQICRQITGLTL